MKRANINSLEEMNIFAKNFLKHIPKSVGDGAVVVALQGNLGSGKTTFVKAVGEALCISEVFSSPTFVISKQYTIPNTPTLSQTKLIHIDAYRLGEKKSLQNIGLDQQVMNSNNIIFIEWPEMIQKELPQKTIYLNFKYISQNTRSIEVSL